MGMRGTLSFSLVEDRILHQHINPLEVEFLWCFRMRCRPVKVSLHGRDITFPVRWLNELDADVTGCSECLARYEAYVARQEGDSLV